MVAKKKSSLSRNILIGLILGIGVGLLFGNYAGMLSYIGDAFIGLLQMTVLPFIIVALIVNIGRLSLKEGKTLIITGLKFLVLLLAIGAAAIVILPLALPKVPTASFFSTSMIVSPFEVDFISLYIPTNPFFSLANSMVPAIVLFCIFLGIGVSGVKNKNNFLGVLDILLEALNKVNKMVVKLTPIGVFAIAASTVGTLSLEEIGKLQAYLILYSFACVILTFGVLPLLVTSTTEIKYKDLFGFTKETLLTIFATGKIIVVLPQLVDNILELNKKYIGERKDVDSNVEILMPLAYPFPNLGSFVILVFVPFAGWFTGNILANSDIAMFLGAGLLSSFVAPVTSIPFLLDLLRIPADLFQLFVISTVYTDRIRVVLGAMHLIVLTILTVASLTGTIKLNKTKLIRGVIGLTIICVTFLVSTHIYISSTSESSEKNFKTFMSMDFLRKPVRSEVFINRMPEKLKEDQKISSVIRIKNRGFLRVGYFKDMLPFAFVNSDGILVGHDVEYAHQLAKELGVSVQFIRIKRNEVISRLDSGFVDIIMSGLALTSNGVESVAYSNPYMNQTMAFITNDYRRSEFTNRENVISHKSLKIGIPYTDYYNEALKEYLTGSSVVNLSSPRSFFKRSSVGKDLDALLYFAEAGSAWTLIYPNFAVTIPHPDVVKVPMVFAVADNNSDLLEFVNNFITLSISKGLDKALFDHWIIGKNVMKPKKHWSIISTVLDDTDEGIE